VHLLEDKAQKESKHVLKNRYWEEHGIAVTRVPLPVGDYVLVNDKIADVIERKSNRNIDIKKMDFVGTYDVCVDTKFDIEEIIKDVCGKDHARFRDECVFAQNNGIKLYVLIENDAGIKCIDDLFKWHNPRLDIMRRTDEIIGYYKTGRPIYKKVQKHPGATRGDRLAKALLTMNKRYGVEFAFCTAKESGRKTLELLGIEV
jgi:ribosome-associated protein